MVSGGSIRRSLALIGATLCMVGISAGSAIAAQPGTCDVHVSPRTAAGGSSFVFSGSGFVPTEMTLHRDGARPISHDLNLGGADPWEATVRSRTGDEGTWTASFSEPALDCTASVEFRVTLVNTDLVDDITAGTTSSMAPVLLYLAVIVFGFSGGVLIGRRVRSRA